MLLLEPNACMEPCAASGSVPSGWRGTSGGRRSCWSGRSGLAAGAYAGQLVIPLAIPLPDAVSRSLEPVFDPGVGYGKGLC